MKNIKVLFFFILCSTAIYSQNYHWGLDLDYFFDNTEYDKSSYIDAGTMNGVWLNPEGAISWDKVNSINVGVNLLLIPGNKKTLEKVDLTIYYQFETDKSLFRVGAFPRKEVLGNYDTFFFKDSVNNYSPQMQGVFWQLGKDRNFVNAWMDWTGSASRQVNENFFIGFSGKVSRGIFFADMQSYMFHRALTKPAIEGEGVSENLQMQIMAGAEYESEKGFKGSIAAGSLMGYERDRRFDEELYKPAGFTARLNAEYWGVGTKNSLYVGDSKMRLYDKFGDQLYWGSQFLRGKSYLKSEWYVKIIENSTVNVNFNFNMHFSERKVHLQQVLSVTASIGNIKPRQKRDTSYPWKNIFK